MVFDQAIRFKKSDSIEFAIENVNLKKGLRIHCYDEDGHEIAPSKYVRKGHSILITDDHTSY